MADTYNPILNKQESRGWQMFQQLPIPEPGTALVFSGKEQHFLTITQGQRRPTRGEMLWGKYNLLYKVDMTEHPLSFRCDLPCATDAFDFHADVRFTCAVHNPEMIVRRNVTDVRQVLEPLIVEVMRIMSCNYQVEESGIAEREIGDRVKKAVYDAGFQLNRFVLTLSLEQEAPRRFRKKRKIQDRAELELEKKIIQSSLDLEKKAQQLHLQRQQIELERRNLQEQLQSQSESEQQSLQELTRLKEQFKLASNIKAPNNKISQPSIQEHRSISSTADNVVASGFPSLASLRAAHSDLLKRHRESGSTPELLAEMEEFIYRGRATGALLDTDEDRWASQSLLDYWSAILYRAGREPPDATLAEFDPALAPELDDARCPYLGLEAFREEKSNLFYGRQRLLEKLVNHLKENRLLAVVGSSGSGKSSVVLGGLLPSLKAGALSGSEDWHYYSPMVPGVNPLENLARLTQPRDVNATEWLQQQVESFQKDPNHLTKLSNDFGNRPSVLVVDQFEEVFTLCRDDRVRQTFIDNLISLIQSPGVRHTVILTMRTDFESQVARVPVFKDLFEQAQVRVTALDASELREAIEKPAELVGLKFEEGLVEALLQDVLGEPAALPLLQFTLLKLWDNRERNRVTWETYKRFGGGRQALARSADEFYEQLIPEEQVTVKRILLRMVRPTEGLEVTSNRIQRKTLYQTGEARDRVDRILNKLIQARLVRLTEGDTPDDAQVELAHEALVRNWSRLVNWLEDERVNMRQRLRLTVAVEQWEAYGREPSALLRGRLLNDALTYKDLNELETEFIQCSIRAEQKERQAEEERRQRQLEQEQRLRAEAESAREQEQLLKRQVTQLEAVNSELRESQQHLLYELRELREPLNSVLGWARLLRTRSFGEATTARALETIERNAQAQAQMIEDILDVSRINGGKLKLNLRPISIIPIIEAAIDAIRPAAEEKAISIESVLDHELEPIPGDPERLQQVVWNLLTNALKFTPKGGRVTVQLERIDSYAQFQVSDTGQGIRAEVLPHIFDRFPQGKGSLTRSDGGLPLVIIRHLVELHEGTIQAESLGEGQGATFIVKLPLTATRIKATDSSSSVKVQ